MIYRFRRWTLRGVQTWKRQVNVPLVADIHFDYRIALKVAE